MRNGKAILLGLALVLVTSVPALADEPKSSLRLDGGPSPSIDRNVPSAAELRQARAWEAHRQRVARIEAKLWQGIDPGRPASWSNPYTQSYYRVYVPQFRIWTVSDFVLLR